MKIGIDISQIVYAGTGVARFTKGLTDAILQYGSDHEWLFFFSALRRKLDTATEEKILKSKHFLKKLRYPPTALSILWNKFHQGELQHITGDLDWFITSDWSEPPSKKIKKATVIHDLAFKRYPETVDKKIRITQQERLKWVQKESQLIFADSKATAGDVKKYLDIDNKKIIVNYPGVEINKPSKETQKRVLDKYKLDRPFILSVGKMEPRKNLKRLVKAMEQIETDEVELIVVGPKGWEDISEKDKRHTIRFLGYVADSDLYALYSSSLFFIMPSIWEGFGYPIIEAMSLGAPVATSNTSSLKEIAGNAALFFDPWQEASIRQSIQNLLTNDTLRGDLIKKGESQSKLFTWKKYYQTLTKSLELHR